MDKNKEKGILLKAENGRRHPAQYLTDLDFADDLGLLSEQVSDAESLLQSLEDAASLVGLYCNESKTKFISTSPSSMSSRSGKSI